HRGGPAAAPEAGGARVPDAAASALLALRLAERVVGGIEHADDDLVLAARGEAAGVEGEMGVPAFVLAEGASVEPHARLPVDAAEADRKSTRLNSSHS